MKIFKLAAFFALVAVLGVSAAFAQKMKAEEILARHLDSIGASEARASIKNQMAIGEVLVTFVSQKNQSAQGRILVVSEGAKNFLGMNLNAADYPAEKFSYDGKNAKVGFVRSNVRSVLGNFVQSNSLLLEESLLGGALTTSWALANTATKKAKISFDGTKKVDGKEMYVLGYSPKGGGDVDIKIFLDKETFRHVRTEYKRTSSAGIGLSPEQSSGFSETRLRVTETFGDFKTETGVTLPHSYVLNYTITGQNGTSEIEWKFNFNQFSFNQNLAPNTFDAEAN